MKSFLFIILLLTSCILTIKVNQIVVCNDKGAKQWSRDVANGIISPWGYILNDYVIRGGALFQAVNMNGEIKVPNTKDVCLNFVSCQEKKMQWMYLYIIQCTPVTGGSGSGTGTGRNSPPASN